MKKKMILTTVFLLIGFAISLPIFIVTENAIIEIITITVGVTLYHFLMRLAVGTIVNLIMKNKANHKSIWFREKSFERKFIICSVYESGKNTFRHIARIHLIQTKKQLRKLLARPAKRKSYTRSL